MPTLRQSLLEAVQTLRVAGVPSPEVDARELVLFAFGLDRTALLIRANEEVSADKAAKLAALIARRAARIPLQHLLGEVEWGGIQLKVDARALIPRPETEVLLELALQKVERGAWNVEKTLAHDLRSTFHLPPAILDIGTGTGAIALALKKAVPDAEVWATDISADALALARENAELNGLQVNFVHGNLLAGLTGPFDFIVSNPPYLPENDAANAQPEVQHDPALALYSGTDGLALARELVRQAAAQLSPLGGLLLELDPRNVHELATEMRGQEQGWKVEVLPDLTGRERFLRAGRPEDNPYS